MSNTGLSFQRANFVVSDLEESLKLYRDILGFEVTFIKDSTPDSYSYPVFGIEPAKVIRFAVLSTADQPRCMALTEIQDFELPPIGEPRRSAIVLQALNFDEVAQKLKENGFKVFPEQVLKTQDGRTGRELGFTDRDGNLCLIYLITSRPS